MGELSLRYAKQLGLTPGHLTIEFGITEQRSTLSLVADLRRLALGEQLLIAHEATSAGDLEGDHDPVAYRQIGDVGPDLAHDAHGFVAEEVARVHEGTKDLVEMKVGSTDVGRVTSMTASVGSSTFGSGTVSTRTSRFPCQVTAFIATSSPIGVRAVEYPRGTGRNGIPACQLIPRPRFPPRDPRY